MVMEASPSPQSVGREFVRQYYTLLNKAPSHLHRFYNNHSSFVHGGLDAPNRETLPVIGQKQIHNRIQQLNFRDCHAKISQVDSQATLGNGVVVQVTGELSNGGAPMRRFTQTFVLAAQSPKKYYVHNDIFRYQDIVLSDEEGEGSTRSEGEDEESTRGYFPPPPTAFPSGGFPPAPMPPAHPHVPPATPLVPAAPPVPPPAAAPAPAPAPTSVPAQTPHLNGHPAAPPHHDDSIRHLGAPLQVTSISSGPEVESVNAVDSENASTPLMPPESEPEPEPEREPTPPPQTAAPPAPPVPPEPKTYANLLKSGGPTAHAQPTHTRSSPPQSGTVASSGGAQSGVTAVGGVAVTEAPRPRPQRPPRDVQPSSDGASGGAGAGTGGSSGAGGASGTSGSTRRYSDSHQLFLGNLPHTATEDELRALFGRFGAIAELRVHSKPATAGGARHPNYGFITYEQPQAAQNCLHATLLYYPPDASDAVKLNVEEKKARGGRAEAARGGRGAARGPPSHRPPFPSRPPYRR